MVNSVITIVQPWLSTIYHVQTMEYHGETVYTMVTFETPWYILKFHGGTMVNITFTMVFHGATNVFQKYTMVFQN